MYLYSISRLCLFCQNVWTRGKVTFLLSTLSGFAVICVIPSLSYSIDKFYYLSLGLNSFSFEIIHTDKTMVSSI